MLKSISRDTDIVARIGGEEFAILLNCPKSEIVSIAEKIRKKTEALQFPDLKIKHNN